MTKAIKTSGEIVLQQDTFTAAAVLHSVIHMEYELIQTGNNRLSNQRA
jgi:hypothetical protein